MRKLKYTPSQQEAISHRNGNLLILACAGSGKTEVISRRIARLVKEGVPRNEIIAFTFTDRAANELKARIRWHLEDLQPDDPSLGDMYVGTIHSFCLHLLKEIDARYRKFEVMDEARQAALIMTNFYYFLDSNVGIGLDQLRSRTRTGGYWNTVRTFITTLNVIHQKGIDPTDIADPDVRAAVERYRHTAYDDPNFFFDFDHIISELLRRLESDPDELERLRQQFQYLVVDEYQDVDDRQERLIHLLSDGGKRVYVTAVGDDDQAIYGWRGASIDNILTFEERYPEVHAVTLYYNFRSTHAIVEIADRAIRELPPGRRIEKAMSARHWDESRGELVETLARQNDIQLRTFSSDDAEAQWIAVRIKQLRGTVIEEIDGERAIDYADMAILLRSVRSSGKIFATVLQDEGIPVVVKGIGGLFDHDEVLLVQAAFCLLARMEFLFEGDHGIERLGERETREFIRKTIRRLQERGAMTQANEPVFLEWIAEKREELDRRNLEKARRGRLARRIYPQDIFQEMLKKLGSAAGPIPWPQEILFNLGRLSNLIAQFEAVHQWVTPKQLGSLCLFLGGWAASNVDEGRLDEAGTPNAVQIMTVHAAKGLEWPVVFVPRVSSYIFPSNLRNRGPETFLDGQLFDPKEYAGGDEGERRLWYVALTRCRQFLNISSQDRYRRRPTVFFDEIRHDCAQRDGKIEDRKKGKPTPPADTELLPTTYTDLSYFWRCPFEYQLRALMGFGPGVKESYGYGQQIHNILAEVHKDALDGNILSADEVAELVEKRFHLRYTRGEPLVHLRNAAKASILRYLAQYPDSTRFVLDAEKPFEFVDRESGALISGTIDLLQCVDATPDGLRKLPVAIIDFKTHRWRKMTDFEQSKREAEDQLLLYAVAVRKALGFAAYEARAHFLGPRELSDDLKSEGAREVIVVDVSPKRQESVRGRVREAVDGVTQSIKSGEFELKGWENGHCRECDFREICPGHACWDQKDRVTPRPGSPEESRAEEMRYVVEDLHAG